MVLGVVHERGSATRAELTQALGLNRSTVGDLVGDLVTAGLVAEDRPDAALPGRVGRPSLLVRPSAGGVCVVAAYVDVHWLRAVRVGLGGQVQERRTEALPVGCGPEVAAARVADLAAALTSGPGQRAGLLGLGVAVPGTVRARDGVVGTAPNLRWSDVPFGAAVAAAAAGRLGRAVRVQVANDADLGIRAEHLRGAARHSADAVYLCGTWGLGGGIISGGHQLTGSHGYAGEVGHVGVDPGGRACHCGSRGCWEAETQALAWAEPLGLDTRAPDIAGQVLRRLAAGGVAARRTRDELSRSFARGLASTINVFDPDVVLLGAGLWRDLWPEVAPDVNPWVDRLVMPSLRDGVRVRPAGLGEDSTLLGAAELALAPLLADPLGRAPLVRGLGGAAPTTAPGTASSPVP